MKVLLIENDVHTRELLLLRLEALACEVLVAASAVEGLRLAREGQPTLILADLGLDGGLGEGVGLLQSLEADPATRDIPVYIHSVYVSHAADAPDALAHADGYLMKPLKLGDLRELLASHTAGGELS